MIEPFKTDANTEEVTPKPISAEIPTAIQDIESFVNDYEKNEKKKKDIKKNIEKLIKDFKTKEQVFKAQERNYLKWKEEHMLKIQKYKQELESMVN